MALSIADAKGSAASDYPITDFKEDLAPRSNKDGLMVFRHVNLSPEFGGKCRYRFFVSPVGEWESPKYTLHFLSSGKEVARYAYNDYPALGYPDWGSLSKMTHLSKYVRPLLESKPEPRRPQMGSMAPGLERYVIVRTIVTD